MSRPLIAIVNDVPLLVRVLDIILTRAGYRTIIYHQGTGAYALLQQAQPALLILDITMEQPDAGWQVLDDLRHDPVFAHLPVLIYSADALIQERVQARADPYCTVLPMFFEQDTLPRLIEQLIAR